LGGGEKRPNPSIERKTEGVGIRGKESGWEAKERESVQKKKPGRKKQLVQSGMPVRTEKKKNHNEKREGENTTELGKMWGRVGGEGHIQPER